MKIERDPRIEFHKEGTLISITRWIRSHDEGIAEWLKNARRAYQPDRTNVAEEHRVALLLFKDSDGAKRPGRIGLLDVGGANLEDVTRWSTWQDPEASGRGARVLEEETQGNGGKAYMFKLFKDAARILGVRDRKLNCKGFDGAESTVERGTPGFIPDAASARDLPNVLWETIRIDVNQFWFELQKYLTDLAKNERTILLFIHGYNVTFEGAALRAAQLGADLNVEGATAFFSWPSKGRVRDYAPDVAAIEGSEGSLREFLKQLALLSGAERIHLIAHSMGNRGTIRAFDALVARLSRELKARFSQIFLAAPDVDVQLFKQLAVAYAKLSERTTMYISDRDKALWGSSLLHDYARAGYKPPVTVVNGIDTVEVSNIDLSFLGHGYIAAARDVLQDIHALMLANTPPQKRMGIEPVADSTGVNYWRIRS